MSDRALVMEYVQQGVELFTSERFCAYRNAAAVIGTLVLLRVSVSVLSGAWSWLRALFLAPLGIGRANLSSHGSWAIVTGASEGIGRGYALELARCGLNVVLMSRSREKLDKVATKIKEKFGSCEVRVVTVDFSRGPEIYPQIAESVQDLDIGVLVNNVGLGYEYPDEFHSLPVERQRKIVELNVQSMVAMTHLVLPKMVAKKRGVIINLSSGVAVMPNVLTSVYAATKSFVIFFSKSLSLEYGSKGIIVQCVAPCYVATAMSGIRQSNLFVADANQYAKSALATVSIMQFTFGTLSHSIQGLVSQFIPECILVRTMESVLRRDKARYLKRKAKGK